MGPGSTSRGVYKFDLSNDFGLHPCPCLPLRLISPSHPTGSLQTGFLRTAVLCVSAPGTEPSPAPALARALTEGGRWNQRTAAVGVWVPSWRSPGPEELEQLREPPLVGACTLPAAVLPLQALRTHVRQLRSPRPGAGGLLLKSYPFWTDVPSDSSPSVRPHFEQTKGCVSYQRLPSPPAMDVTL